MTTSNPGELDATSPYDSPAPPGMATDSQPDPWNTPAVGGLAINSSDHNSSSVAQVGPPPRDSMDHANGPDPVYPGDSDSGN